jgi:hypothetical protein
MKKNRREAFDKFEYEPSPEVWKNIEKNLPVKKKRRYFLLWFLPVIILAGLALKWSQSNKPGFPAGEREEINYSVEPLNSGIKKGNEIVSQKVNKHQKEIASVPIKPEEKNGKSIYDLDSKVPERNRNSVNHSVTKQDLIINNGDNLSADNRAAILDENLHKLPSLWNSLSVESTSPDILRKEDNHKKEKMLSRWSLFAEGGVVNSSLSENAKSEESAINYKSINRFSLGCGIGYDINSRWRISTGIFSTTKGANEKSEHTIILNGDPGDPDNSYTIVSPSGDLNGRGSDFNLVYFGSENMDLFPISASLTPVQTPEKKVYFSTRTEFQCIQFPLSLAYKFSGGRLTPEIGMTLSTEYLNKYSVYINDKRLDYQYTGSLRKIVFSAVVQAGLSCALSRSWGIYMAAGYHRGLTSLFNDKSISLVSTGLVTGVKYRIGYRK